MPNGVAATIAFLEIAGGLCIVIPIDLWPPHVLVRLASASLALIAMIVGIHQARRHDHATPAITMFILAIFILVGRWPIH